MPFNCLAIRSGYITETVMKNPMDKIMAMVLVLEIFENKVEIETMAADTTKARAITPKVFGIE